MNKQQIAMIIMVLNGKGYLCDGFKWKNINVFLIFIGFVNDLKPFVIRWIVITIFEQIFFHKLVNMNYVMKIGQI
jgi:hypothetical protein